MTVRLRRATATAATGLGLCLAALPAGQAHALPQAPQAPIRVACDDITALRAAIVNANTSGRSIVLASRCIYSIRTADNADDALPEITGKVRISGGEGTTVRRGPSAAAAFRVFHVRQQGSLSLNSLTVRGGAATSSTAQDGGGIYNEQGRVTLTDVTVRNNASGFLGGGIWNNRGSLVLKDTIVGNNTSRNGAGVATNGTMTMRGGALVDNTADNWAGGLANGGRTTLHKVSAAGNEAAEGGGLMQVGISGRTGPLRANFTQVTGNTAERGGGILIGSAQPTTLYRSVVTRNTAVGGRGSGGGIYNSGAFYEILTATGTQGARTSKAAAAPPLAKVNLIRSAVFNNTPDNCAPPNSVPRCQAVGSAPSKNTTKPGRS